MNELQFNGTNLMIMMKLFMKIVLYVAKAMYLLSLKLEGALRTE